MFFLSKLFSKPPLIEYKISVDRWGLCYLTIWEPAPTDQVRLKPYRFSVNYKLTSEAEAHQLLDNYIKMSGARVQNRSMGLSEAGARSRDYSPLEA